MKITFKKLANIIFKEIILKMENNSGLVIFAKERAKFEGWLKVELCEILSKYFSTVIPETVISKKDRIDVTFDNWAIELKIINTNYKYKNVKSKRRPITKNINGVIKDIEKLKSTNYTNYTNKTVLFVVFPVTHDYEEWKKHLKKISEKLDDLKYKEFKFKIKHKNFRFKSKIPGVIYFGLIK